MQSRKTQGTVIDRYGGDVAGICWFYCGQMAATRLRMAWSFRRCQLVSMASLEVDRIEYVYEGVLCQ